MCKRVGYVTFLSVVQNNNNAITKKVLVEDMITLNYYNMRPQNQLGTA